MCEFVRSSVSLVLGGDLLCRRHVLATTTYVTPVIGAKPANPIKKVNRRPTGFGVCR